MNSYLLDMASRSNKICLVFSKFKPVGLLSHLFIRLLRMLEAVGLWTLRLAYGFLVVVFFTEDRGFVAVLGVLFEMRWTFACALPNSTWFTCVANLREHNVSCTHTHTDFGSHIGVCVCILQQSSLPKFVMLTVKYYYLCTCVDSIVGDTFTSIIVLPFLEKHDSSRYVNFESRNLHTRKRKDAQGNI